MTNKYLEKYLPKNYKVIEDVEPSKKKEFDFIDFLKNGEDYIEGEVMRERSKELNANLGLADAIYLLENQNLILEDLQSKYLVFSGTLLRGSDGNLCVPFLFWNGGRWILSFFWLARVWGGRGRFACNESSVPRSLGTSSSGSLSLGSSDPSIDKSTTDRIARLETKLDKMVEFFSNLK